MVLFILISFIVYKIIQAILLGVWNWLLEFLSNIITWISPYFLPISFCIVLIFILFLCLQYLTTPARKSTQTNSIPIMNSPSVIDQEAANFNRWYQLQQDRTLVLTKDMIEKMNEMLKSSRHRKEIYPSYQQILQKNGLGYVYFIKTPDGTTKIGSTGRDPFKRAMEVFGGVNTSYDVRVIHLIRTNSPKMTESSFHKYFSNKKFINKYNPDEESEFFHLKEEDWVWIKGQQYPESIRKTISY
ncbi:GIY-YIG nuclease family protein [Sporosarcina koreensis]|uniref:GIY-YIG nuclease family protein n=1 Tax=Sporosarcina koreensis TaxID=334735 RepID=A0ABW0U181_9BACL